MYTYTSYYLNTILKNTIGFKPVIGGTGLGKTYGLIQAIKESITQKPDLQYVYSTNRHALIKEVIKDLEKANIFYVYLKSDKEIFLDLIKSKSLENILFDLVEKGFFDCDIKLGSKPPEKIKKEIKRKLDLIEVFQEVSKSSSRDSDEDIGSYLEKPLIELVSFVKSQFYQLRKQNRKKHQSFLLDKQIWQLFPYIEFEQNPEIKVLLATIQKLCYGFFDGTKKQKLPVFENKVIFLDEFDFLENEILTVLAQETPLDNPLEFAKIFYERFKLIKNKSFWQGKTHLIDLKQGLEKAEDILTKGIKKHKFKFPQLTDFIYNPTKFPNKKIILFQTNRTILSQNFYLNQKKDAWEIVRYQSKSTVKPLYLFAMIKQCIKQILDTCNRHIQRNESDINYVIKKVWNVKNDNKTSANEKYIKDISLFKNTQASNPKIKEDEFDYIDGFSLIELSHNDANLDPLDVDLRQIELSTSPEALITQLSNRNLVFGLSATSDIPRVVVAFHEEWLKKHCQFIEPNDNDRKLLADMKQEKDATRQSEVVFFPNKSSKISAEISEELERLKSDTTFFQDDEKETSEEALKNRLERVKKTFACLEWILNESQNRSHLVFLTTFKRFKKVIEGNVEIDQAIREQFVDIFQVENVNDIGYKVQWGNKTCNIIFLDAKKAKEIEEDKASLEENKKNNTYDNLMNDTEVDKVILVTQYATASNGVNLGFIDKEGVKRDFEGIHLLEAKFYWFDTNEDNRQNQNAKKQMFWYLWKLYDKGEISKGKFKYYLEKADPQSINSFYTNTEEYTLNQMALFHQALGRVERQRQYKQPLIEVTLGEDVLSIFNNFLSPRYQAKEALQKKLSYTATTITQLYEAVENFLDEERMRRLNLPTENISDKLYQSIDIIRKLLNEIEKVKNGEYQEEPEIAKEIIQVWKEIRENVLSQNYDAEIELTHINRKIGKNKIIFKDFLVFETDLIQKDGTLYMTVPDEEDEDAEPAYQLYAKKQITIPNLRKWDLDQPFRYLKKNKTLKKLFEENNYPLGHKTIDSNFQKIFTPYIEQAILKGAIGEEAIQELLIRQGVYMQELDEVDKRIFEIADAKVQGLPIYIDFKNFSPYTADKYNLYDVNWDLDNDFDPEKLAREIAKKIDRIQKVTKEQNVKIILINFVLRNFKNQYYTKDLKLADSFEKCDIAIIPSTIQKDKPHLLFEGFKKFVNFIKEELKKQKSE